MTDDVQFLTDGLRFPEGPVALPGGDLIVVEIEGRRLTRIRPDGSKSVVARLDGGPNGAAIGPNGLCYICNNGGMSFRDVNGELLPMIASDDYKGGWIETVDLVSGEIRRLYDRWRDRPLSAPNDIVFDALGGFYFTDSGKMFRHQSDRGAVYYAAADGSLIQSAIFPIDGPNGIGLSPDGQTLYVAETKTARLWAFDLMEPGKIRRGGGPVEWEHGRLVFARDAYALFDSLAVEADGNICVTEIPSGRVLVISPAGRLIEEWRVPDRFTTNICFGGERLQAAYVTLSTTGRVARIAWNRSGLAPHWSGL